MGSFANNDVVYEDPSGADHDSFGFGLKKSLLNYMHNIGLDEPLQKWFDHKVPKTKIDAAYISNVLSDHEPDLHNNYKVLWLGGLPSTRYYQQSKKGNSREMVSLSFITNTGKHEIDVLKDQGEWLRKLLQQASVRNEKMLTIQEVKHSYEEAELEDFELFWDNKPVNMLYKAGLLRM